MEVITEVAKVVRLMRFIGNQDAFPMKFGYTILYVADVRSAVDFYTHAFGVLPRFIHESGDFAELETGATRLAFSSRRLMEELGKQAQAPSPERPVFEIAFVVEDVLAALRQALDAGATLVQEPQRMPWGQTVAYVSDPEGFLVELCTEMGA